MNNYTIAMGMLTIFISVFMLFFVFDNLENLAEGCKSKGITTGICQYLNTFAISMVMILLIIGGFILIVSVTAYILLSA